MGMKTTLSIDSSGEFWTMRNSMTQRINDKDEGYGGCKFVREFNND